MTTNKMDELMNTDPVETGLASRKKANTTEAAAHRDNVLRTPSKDLMSEENIQKRIMNQIKTRGPLPEVKGANPTEERLFWGSTSEDARPSIAWYFEMGASFAGKEHVSSEYQHLFPADYTDEKTGQLRAREMVLMVIPMVYFNAWMTQVHHKEPAKMGTYARDEGLTRNRSQPIGYAGILSRENMDKLVSRDDVLFSPNHAKQGTIEPIKKPTSYDNLAERVADADFFEKNILNPNDY